MNKLFHGLLLFLFALSTAQASELTEAELAQLMVQGGYIIYLRHAMTDHSQKDVDRKNLENCGTQRNLSEQGKNRRWP